MVKIRTLDGVDVRGKRVLLRADLNVPVKDGHVTDATRIGRLAPTISELADQACMSHCSDAVQDTPAVWIAKTRERGTKVTKGSRRGGVARRQTARPA